MTRRSRRMAGAALAAACLVAGCGARTSGEGVIAPADSTLSLPVRVELDRAAEPLAVRPPVRVWVGRVSPTRPVDPAAIAVPDPGVAEVPAAADPPPALAVDPGLLPPILRTPAALTLPARARPATVELDVRVDEAGTVSDALWAGGSVDSLLVAAAVASALGMRFHPALQAGRPVAVWCRQRFDFGR